MQIDGPEDHTLAVDMQQRQLRILSFGGPHGRYRGVEAGMALIQVHHDPPRLRLALQTPHRPASLADASGVSLRHFAPRPHPPKTHLAHDALDLVHRERHLVSPNQVVSQQGSSPIVGGIALLPRALPQYRGELLAGIAPEGRRPAGARDVLQSGHSFCLEEAQCPPGRSAPHAHQSGGRLRILIGG
jgi:hypothetical protein